MKGFQIYSILISCGIRESLCKVCLQVSLKIVLRVNVSLSQDIILDLSEMDLGMVAQVFFFLQVNLNTAILMNITIIGESSLIMKRRESTVCTVLFWCL